MTPIKPKSRRETLKLLTLAGFGLMLPSCLSSSNEVDTIIPALIPEPIIDQDSLLLEQTLDKLEKELETENVLFLTQDHPDYERNRNGFNLNHQKHPKIIALCKNTSGVREAMKYANRMNLKVAIKSGGHSFEGYSSNNDGLVINLTLMNQMKWVDNTILKSGPAVLLTDLYDFILPENRIIPVGSCGTVGLSGLTLGGGYGFFSRQHGLACDNLIEATLVDGNGEVHIAVEGDELMWALRGGGNGNFGVITELKYRTHQAPESFIRYRLQAYNLDKERAKCIMQTWFDHSAVLPNECFSAHVLNGSTITILITNYGEDNEVVDTMVSVLSEIMDKTSIGNRKALEDTLSTYFGTMHSIYFKNSSAGYYDNYSTIEGCIDDILDVVLNNKVIFQINTLGGEISNQEHQSNSCYPHRNSPYLCELQSYWKKDSQKESRLTAFNKVQEILNNHGINKQYRNYPNVDFPNWEQAYFGKYYRRLQKIKAKYDINNVIQHEQSIKLAD
jgi:hypothetical protein